MMIDCINQFKACCLFVAIHTPNYVLIIKVFYIEFIICEVQCSCGIEFTTFDNRYDQLILVIKCCRVICVGHTCLTCTRYLQCIEQYRCFYNAFLFGQCSRCCSGFLMFSRIQYVNKYDWSYAIQFELCVHCFT